ncbi:MAG: acylneuraminate cytidylyltransferase family protein [Sphingobium sp.]
MSRLDPIVAFLPCRKGSERVPKKNIRPFAGVKNGLIEIKLMQLLACPEIDEVILSTNDQEILKFAEKFSGDRLRVHRRAEELSSSLTSTDELVAHARSIIVNGHILWTHVTSPFVTSDHYSQIIATYLDGLDKGYDSLMTTTLLHAFLWTAEGPINYDRAVEKWPRTQTLPALHEVNSAAFLAPCEIYDIHRDRIGNSPILYTLDKLQSIDIDWEADFHFAEQLLLHDMVKL